MRTLKALLLSITLSGCVISSYVELSGPGGQNDSKCDKGAYEQLSIDLPDGAHMYVTSAPAINGGTHIQTQFQASPSARRVAPNRLLSLRAKLNVAPDSAPISQVRINNSTTPQFVRAVGDQSDVIMINGVSLLETELALQSSLSNINYLVPNFSELSAKITLPSMLINGKRVDIPPVTMTKKMSSRPIFCH
jgi:hypothetical protein